jgi:ergothioneine biosynthesis protein EgtB
MRVLALNPEIKHSTLERESSALKDRFVYVRNYTEEICRPLKVDDYLIQLTADGSSPKWHLAHTTWYFEQHLLVRFKKNYQRFNPLFATLYDEDDGDLSKHTSRPTLEEVLRYRKYVDIEMLELIPCLPNDANLLLETAINHEQQHQELLFVDIKYILGSSPLHQPYKTSFCESSGNSIEGNDFVVIPGGEYSIGYSGYGFSYDNEHQAHRVMLKPFEISKHLVTNGEYCDFMQAGGYQRMEYWFGDGWKWINENKILAPLYWEKVDGVWHRYALGGFEPVDMTEPVTHISYYEAAAYAAWKKLRLPTEFEWEAAADHIHWGERWEFTNSAYLPYPGYVKPNGVAARYNSRFMINTMVLRGASVVTPPNHSRKSYRNFCYADQRRLFNGIRLCRDQAS